MSELGRELARVSKQLGSELGRLLRRSLKKEKEEAVPLTRGLEVETEIPKEKSYEFYVKYCLHEWKETPEGWVCIKCGHKLPKSIPRKFLPKIGDNQELVQNILKSRNVYVRKIDMSYAGIYDIDVDEDEIIVPYEGWIYIRRKPGGSY